MASTQLTRKGTDPETDPTETCELWIMGTTLCSFHTKIRTGPNDREEKKTEFATVSEAEHGLSAEIARLTAAGFVLREARKPAPKPQPSAARAPGPAPAWLANADLEKALKKLRAAAKKVGLGHRFDELANLTAPALELSAKKSKTPDLKKVVSRIGGEPDLPAGHPWPTWNGAPLNFVAQIVVAEVKDKDLAGRLPKDGVLSFFAQLESEVPEHGEQCVIEHHSKASDLKRTAPPLPTRVLSEATLTASKLLLTIPPAEGPVIEGLGLNDDEQSAYHDDLFLGPLGEGPNHRLLGWPTAATHHSIQGKRFVLQIDSDNKNGFEMGDYNALRFYVDGDVLDASTLKTAVCTLSEA